MPAFCQRVQLHSRPSFKRFPKDWQALCGQRQRREDQMWLRLIPERHRRKIVAASIGMAMFDRYPNLFFEDNRILDVKTVDGYRVSPILAAVVDSTLAVAPVAIVIDAAFGVAVVTIVNVAARCKFQQDTRRLRLRRCPVVSDAAISVMLIDNPRKMFHAA
jgi:hypothetical protein